MRREDHATAVASPAVDVERSVVIRNVGIARVAEDGFDEIEIADQAARCDEPPAGRLQHIHPGKKRAALGERPGVARQGVCTGTLRQALVELLPRLVGKLDPAAGLSGQARRMLATFADTFVRERNQR